MPVPAGATVEIPVTGYCGDVRKPPIPEGEPAPGPADWIVVTDPVDAISIPPKAGAPATGRAMVPGTDTPVPRAISAAYEPLLEHPYCWLQWSKSNAKPPNCRPVAS